MSHEHDVSLISFPLDAIKVGRAFPPKLPFGVRLGKITLACVMLFQFFVVLGCMYSA